MLQTSTSAFLGAATLTSLYMRARLHTRAHAPVATRKTAIVTIGAHPGQFRGNNPMEPAITQIDTLYWLRDDKRQNPEILDHLKRENAHTEFHTAHLQVF